MLRARQHRAAPHHVRKAQTYLDPRWCKGGEGAKWILRESYRGAVCLLRHNIRQALAISLQRTLAFSEHRGI